MLLVDDDTRIREILQKYLIDQGYWCTTASGPAAADRLLLLLRFELIIMDVMMPHEDGINFTRRLRKKMNIPVIMLSAKGEVEDRIAGLSAGADDYLPKPFGPRELVLRIEAVLRRAQTEDIDEGFGGEVRFGEFSFNLKRGELLRGDLPVRLTGSEIAILRQLAQSPNNPVERRKLGDETDEELSFRQERGIDMKISRLRQKVEEDPRNPRYLLTVRGTGYMLVAS